MDSDQLGQSFQIDEAPTLGQLEGNARLVLWRLLDGTYPDERRETALAAIDRVLAMRAQAGAAADGLAEYVSALRGAIGRHEAYLSGLDKAMAVPLRATETVAGLRAWAVGLTAVELE